jgi:hypothetical protein
VVTLGEAFTKHDVLWAVKPSTQLGFRADLNINDIGETHDSPVKLGFILYSVQYIYIYVHKLHCITLHYHYHLPFSLHCIYIYVHAYKTWHYITAHCITLFNYIITLHYVTLHYIHYITYITYIYTHIPILYIYIAQPRKTQKTLTHIYKYTNTI